MQQLQTLLSVRCELGLYTSNVDLVCRVFNLKWHEYRATAERGCFDICTSTLQMEQSVVFQWQQCSHRHTMLLFYTYIAHIVVLLFIYFW